MDNFWGEHASDPSDLTPTIQPKKLTNLVPLPNGRYRAYTTENNKKVYIGTYNSKDEAIEAQLSYSLTGELPPRKRRKRDHLKLSQIIDTFFDSNGLPENE